MSTHIATDIFLLCIKEFLESIQEIKLAKKIESAIEHNFAIKEKYHKKFKLTKMMYYYLKQNQDLKKYLEKLSQSMIEIEESDKDESSLQNSKRKQSLLSSNKNKKEENTLLKKKRKKSQSNISNKSKSKIEKDEDEESDFSINPEKIRAKYGIKDEDLKNINNKPNNGPFRRIDPSIYKIDKKELSNNSYDYYANLSGNNMGSEANNRLKITAGKDFKKEKNKFKNKSGFGGTQISMDVKSTKLDFGSDSD